MAGGSAGRYGHNHLEDIMHPKRRSLVVFIAVLLVSASFTLCQKGVKKGASTAGKEVTLDQSPLKFEMKSPEGKELPRPPEVYVGDWKPKGEKPGLYTKAEGEFEKKKYKSALDLFEELTQKEPRNYWAAGSRLEMARCHYQLSQFDEALELLKSFIDSKPGLIWEARTMTVLSELLLTLPYYGYEKGGKVSYNYDVREGEYKYMSDENREEAVSYREKARLAYIGLLGAPQEKRGAAPGDDLKLEAIVSSFTLLEIFEQQYWLLSDRCPPAKPLDPPAKGSMYDPGWTPREKALFLMDEIAEFNRGRSDRHPEAWAGFKKALFLVRYPECPPKEWSQEREKTSGEWSEKHKDEFDPPAYLWPVYEPPEELSPLKIIGKVIKNYPGDEEADLYLATKGRILESLSEYVKAKGVYEEFLEKFGKSKWEDDALSSLHEMQHPALSASGDSVGYPGQDDVLYLSTRNIPEVRVDIYEIDLPAIVKKPSVLSEPYADFSNTYSCFKDFKGARKQLKKKVGELVYKTRDQGDYRWVSGKAKLPKLPLGAYLLHEQGSKVEAIALFIKTDMIIVGKPLTDSVQYMVSDSKTGSTLKGVELLLKESYYDYSYGNERRVKISSAKTDADGRTTYSFTKGANISSNYVQALAQGGGGSVALTGSQYATYYYRGETDETYKIFTTTDRPVYRPGDTIHFKHIVRSYKDGKNKNVPSIKVKMEVENPKGEKIFEKVETSTMFGTVWGETKVDGEAMLGVYTVRAQVVGSEYRSYQSSGSQVRVEEYKKPEFEVEVKPSAKLATAGQKVSALIKAAYYWGAPAVEASVKYKVYRSVYWHGYSPPDRWDWLYGKGYGLVWEQPYAGGEELVSDGEGTTDETGSMEVTLPEFEAEAKYDYEYKVVADVTDLSRRTISGSGSVKVTRDPFYVHVVTPMSFYTEGDSIEAEILAMTADDEPVAAQGKAQLVRVTYPAAEEEKEQLVQESEVKLDAKGRAFFKVTFKEAGQYRVRFMGKFKGSKEVKGETFISAAGKEFGKQSFRFKNVQVLSQQRTYARGDQVKVLVATPWEDAVIWLTLEGGDEVLHDVIKRPKGGSLVMTFEAKEEHQPNVFIRAIVVHDNAVQITEREIFIPPVESILMATVESDRGEYKPREKGKLSVTVKDYKGKPLQGEFSMSVFDSSVLYIQGETGGDIRPYYYGDRRYIGVYPFHSAQLWFSPFNHDANKWPDLKPAGLPTSSGYFYQPFQPGMQFLCPSCPVGGSGGGGYYALDGFQDENGIADNLSMLKADQSKMEISGKEEAVTSTIMPNPAAAVDKEVYYKSPPAESPALGQIGKGSHAITGESMNMGGPGGAGALEVREYFPDTAFWKPDVVTGKDGKASVEIEWPDSLTTWAVRVVGVDGAARVAIAGTEAMTTKKLVARLETPRFLVEGDRVKLAAVVSSDYDEPLQVTLKIAITGEAVEAVGAVEAKITGPAGKDARKDFEIQAIHAEEAKIQLSAVASKDSDALVKTFEVLEWGSDKMLTRSDILRKPGKISMTFDVPKERKADTAELTVTAEPSIAGSLLRALPFLIHYPYGCVEQTMSRFLPAVLVARTLKDAGVSLSGIPALAKKASLADPVAWEQAKPQLVWWEQPVYDDKELDKIVKVGLKRLYGFQHGDGGWAWWEMGDSDPYMSAYVLIGLVEASEAGYLVDPTSIERGMNYLHKQLEKMNKLQGTPREQRAFAGYALSLKGKVKYEELRDVFEHREEMSHYGQALVTLAMWKIDEKAKAKEGLASLIDVSWVDEGNKTASFKWKKEFWWEWYYDRVETVAWTLRALMTIEPGHKYGDYYAKWLMLNRQGSHWYSTKDTAIALYGLTLYMRQHQELSPDCDVKILVGGKERKSLKFTKENALAGEGTVLLRGKEIGDGSLEVAVEMKGSCSVYANAFLTYFTKEAKIEGSGNEIFIDRTYWKLIEKKTKVKTWHGEITKLDYDRVQIKEGDEVKSGELIEVKVVVEAKNDYEYLVFEDFKPAGCEPMELKSGGVFENGAWVYRELRDEKVVNFLYLLPQGKQTISYKMRAEIPGVFRILPHKGYAMYAPRVRAISNSAGMTISP
jgi:uncharacterized protein YfaS (alpha-2-macroglobulin family)